MPAAMVTILYSLPVLTCKTHQQRGVLRRLSQPNFLYCAYATARGYPHVLVRRVVMEYISTAVAIDISYLLIDRP